MRKVILLNLVSWLLLLSHSYGQECTHTNLSYKFDYKISATRVIHHPGPDSVKVLLSIYKKHTKEIIQQITIKPFVEDYSYNNCTNIRSYISGYHQNNEVLDFDFGDLVVADLNFDGKEDFAIKRWSGGNGGPLYDFYIQDHKGLFKLDHFLTDSIRSFPKYIDKKHKTLTTQINPNSRHGANKKIYKYNPVNKKWRMIKWIDFE